MPSAVLNHPLKSAHQIALFAAYSFKTVPCARERLRPWERTKPFRCKIRLTLLSEGHPASNRSLNLTKSFGAPHFGQRALSSRISFSTSLPSALGCSRGARDRSSKPAHPSSSKRSIHLYAVFRLIPYRRAKSATEKSPVCASSM